MQSAEADLARAQAIRSVGMSPDVDVLSIRVHLAGVREQQIRRAADQDVARAALNDVLGMPLDTPHTLSEPLSPMNHAAMQLSIYEKKALLNRPDARQLKLSTSLAKNQAGRGPKQPLAHCRGSWGFRRRPAAILQSRRRQLARVGRAALESVQWFER